MLLSRPTWQSPQRSHPGQIEQQLIKIYVTIRQGSAKINLAQTRFFDSVIMCLPGVSWLFQSSDIFSSCQIFPSSSYSISVVVSMCALRASAGISSRPGAISFLSWYWSVVCIAISTRDTLRIARQMENQNSVWSILLGLADTRWTQEGQQKLSTGELVILISWRRQRSTHTY